LAGTGEEWDRFCRDLSTCLDAQVKLWRKWPRTTPISYAGYRPEILITFTIGDDGRISTPDSNMLTSLIGVEAKRLKECRKCQQIFWASRIDMVACDPRCANALRQREFENKKRRK
jgi:hypothetical protein